MKITINEKQYKFLLRSVDNFLKEQKYNIVMDDPSKADFVTDDVTEFFQSLKSIKKPIFQQEKGDKTPNKEVETVQIALSLLGYTFPIHGIDGIFGSETAKNVERYKRDNNIIDIEKIDESFKFLFESENSIVGPPIAGELHVNSKFGPRGGRMHWGVDLRAKSGTNIISPESGEITQAEYRKGSCGGTLVIKHDNGTQSRFCHIKKFLSAVGTKVSKGEVVALSGGDSSDMGRGNSKHAHVHYELKIKSGSSPVDPMKYIDKVTKTITPPKDNIKKSDIKKSDIKKTDTKISEPDKYTEVSSKIFNSYISRIEDIEKDIDKKLTLGDGKKYLDELRKIKKELVKIQVKYDITVNTNPELNKVYKYLITKYFLLDEKIVKYLNSTEKKPESNETKKEKSTITPEMAKSLEFELKSKGVKSSELKKYIDKNNFKTELLTGRVFVNKSKFTAQQLENINLLLKEMNRIGIKNPYNQIGILSVIGKESKYLPKSEGGYQGTSLERILGKDGTGFKGFSVFKKNVSLQNEFLKKKKDYKDGKITKEEFNKWFFKTVYAKTAGNEGGEDGWIYRGRGFNQLTGRGNYLKNTEDINKIFGMNIDLVTNPELVNDRNIAIKSALVFFTKGMTPGAMRQFTNKEEAVKYFTKLNHSKAGQSSIESATKFSNNFDVVAVN